MNSNRKFWNEKQGILRSALLKVDNYQNTIEILLHQHAMVHTAEMTQSQLWSFEDELWQDLSEEVFRSIPKNSKNSIAWHIWHSTRIEDITMNTLVADRSQIFDSDNWLEQMKIAVRDTGNAMDENSIRNLSLSIDMEALRAYRLAVGQRTREIIMMLQPEQLKQKVDPSRLKQMMDQGDVVEDARWLRDYWSKRKIAGLLLMPATRHNFVHLNKSLRIKK